MMDILSVDTINHLFVTFILPTDMKVKSHIDESTRELELSIAECCDYGMNLLSCFRILMMHL